MMEFALQPSKKINVHTRSTTTIPYHHSTRKELKTRKSRNIFSLSNNLTTEEVLSQVNREQLLQ